MRIVLDVAPETEAHLVQNAKKRNQTVSEYLQMLAEQDRPLPERNSLDANVQRMQNRTSEERAAMRERLLAKSKPPRPLLPGETLEAVIVGKWPGDETNEEIQTALEELS